MKINQKISGFRLISTEDAAEISAKLNIFDHEKSGAKLCFIEREDRNLSFGISFYTPPKDSTGVFHIIEHSVLCGSEKYPVKEPFVELLKSSLNTFLNAMTYEDKTVYPVSSRCEEDFYNLVNVYLDAVFHPLMLKDELIFLQEGHRLECDKETGEISFNGVVFNEMQGAYSSPDELAAAKISKILFEGTPYGYDSGGSPDEIPDLTYDEFCAMHKKYYTPKNSLILLDGSVNLEKTLALIDSYLSEYEGEREKYRPIKAVPKVTPTVKVSYQGEGTDKPRLTLGSVFADAKDKLTLQAAAVLVDVLLGSNEAPLKRAMLSSGLCEDIIAYINRAQSATLLIEVFGIPEGREKEAEELLYSSIRKICADGIEKEQITATLNRLKFRLRERDGAGYPRGIANILSVLEGWHYGIEPLQMLTAEDCFEKLCALLPGDYFERTLEKITVESPHRASVLLIPGDEPSEISKIIDKKLSEAEAALTDRERERIDEVSLALEKKQTEPDSEEARRTIPALKVSDIEVVKSSPDTSVRDYLGAKILCHKVDIKGILYTELYFYAKNLSPEELTELSLLSSFLTNLDTEEHSAAEIKTEIKSSLGGFAPLALAYSKVDTAEAIPIFLLRVSSLAEKAQEGVDLISEVLLKTDFSSSERIKTLLTQIRSATEATALANGDGIATERAEAASTPVGAVNEELMGLSSYRRIKALEENFDERFDALVSSLKKLVKTVFTRENLILAVAGEAPEGYAEQIVSLFPEGVSEAREHQFPKIPKKQGIKLPVRVGHSALSFISPQARELFGPLKVAGNILSFEYLWTQVRLRGGAYGAGMSSRRTGQIIFSSYRDPKPKRSIDVFMGAGRFLREFLDNSPDLKGYIIGAVGDFDILKTPRASAFQATADYIMGWDGDMDAKLLSDILNCDREALYKVCDMLDREICNGAYCAVGSQELLSELTEAEIISPRE